MDSKHKKITTEDIKVSGLGSILVLSTHQQSMVAAIYIAFAADLAE